MRADFHVPEPSKHAWLSAGLSVAVLVFVALLVLCALIAIRILRRMRERSALWAAWTKRTTAKPVPLSAEDTREIAVPHVPGGPRHRVRNERSMRARVSNAGGRMAATVARAKGRQS